MKQVNSKDPIGIFDSGVGGLTVMRALIEDLPGEDMLYLGDTARVPYGNRGAETVRRYALNAAELLVDHSIKALVVACNTASAFALETLKASVSIPVFGVIEPVARAAAAMTTTGHIAVLGTRGTIRSEAYQEALLNLQPTLHVHPLPCPLLVPLAEEGWTEGMVTEEILRHYLVSFSHSDVDTMILGCTHYPLLAAAIEKVAREVVSPGVKLVDSARATSQAVTSALGERGLLREATQPGEHRFLLTDLPEGFISTAERFFGRSLDGACEHVDIRDRSVERGSKEVI